MTTHTPSAEMLALADELDAFHDCADGDVQAGNGHFRLQCVSGSDDQRMALRAVLHEAAQTIRRLAASSPDYAGMRDVLIKMLIIEFQKDALLDANHMNSTNAIFQTRATEFVDRFYYMTALPVPDGREEIQSDNCPKCGGKFPCKCVSFIQSSDGGVEGHADFNVGRSPRASQISRDLLKPPAPPLAMEAGSEKNIF